jgi:hypothetical protein
MKSRHGLRTGGAAFKGMDEHHMRRQGADCAGGNNPEAPAHPRLRYVLHGHLSAGGEAQRNYSGPRLSPWLNHLMVSRQETPRPLLTPGEVMQLPQDDELVMMSGCPPIRAKKARYYEDGRFKAHLLPPPSPQGMPVPVRPDDWSSLPRRHPPAGRFPVQQAETANSGRRREPEPPCR